MIKVGNTKIDVKHFPDGTQCLMDCDVLKYTLDGTEPFLPIIWNYESDEELITLIYLVNHIREYDDSILISLFMPYIPNARMDRTKNPNEIFTLKYFANIINGLKFHHVDVLDPHSDVSVALINNVRVITPDDYIAKTIQVIKDMNHINDNYIVIYFPDNGAYKRYKDMKCLAPYKKIYGQKVRDWKTGIITGLKVVNENDTVMGSIEAKDGVWALASKYVLMIDDIISYGGTMYYSALKLSEFKPNKIYCYATHVEAKSFWDIEKGTFRKAMGFTNPDGSENAQIVEKLYTTNSIYNYDGNDFVIPISL